MKQVLALAALCCAFPAAAQVYKCKDANGTMVYAEKPCGADARAVDTRPAMAPSAPTYGIPSYSVPQGQSRKSQVSVRNETKVVWVCQDGTVSGQTCQGGRPKRLDDLSASELNAYTKERIAAEKRAEAERKAEAARAKTEEERAKAEEAERNRKEAAGCAAAFAGKPPVTNSAFDGSVRGVESYLKATLKDPDSYQSIEWSSVVKGCGSYLVRHKYRAKNSFGGYVINNTLFSINPDGVVTAAIEAR